MARYYPPIVKRSIFLASDFDTRRISAEFEYGPAIPGQIGSTILSLGESIGIFPLPQMKEGMYFLTIQTQGSLPLSTTSGFSTISVIQTSIDALPLYTFTPSSLKGSITALVKTTGIWLYAPVVTNTASFNGYFITNHDLNEPVRVWWELNRLS